MNELVVLQKLMADDHARRELLWLRAKEKEDDITARDLERVDPELVRRLRDAGADVSERDYEGARERRERYGRLHDECHERHATRIRAARG
jgi:hypothetical protein